MPTPRSDYLTPTGFEAAKIARQLAEDIYWGGDR
jgi:hypothetical protein